MRAGARLEVPAAMFVTFATVKSARLRVVAIPTMEESMSRALIDPEARPRPSGTRH